MESPQLQFINKVADISVVAQRQIPVDPQDLDLDDSSIAASVALFDKPVEMTEEVFVPTQGSELVHPTMAQSQGRHQPPVRGRPLA